MFTQVVQVMKSWKAGVGVWLAAGRAKGMIHREEVEPDGVS